ncbi:hemolysin III family protein [Glaciecola siphonariae]|uniref:Hemolysin III family protein n=1 Tax=Glaciecola siphonariae TaxID=521012 RepID=A0ABV9LT97_9ALTE
MLPLKPASMDPSAYSNHEEWLSSATHALGAVMAIVGLILLVQAAQTNMGLFSAWVYGVSLVAMFLSSSSYHLTKAPARRILLRKIDHIAIYLLIAGSYTPILLIAVDTYVARIGTIIIWFIALAGILFKLILGHKYPKISIITYAVMGWMALFMIYPIYLALSDQGFLWLIAGGLCYSAGIPLYLLKSRHFSHALWHLFVLGGAVCHFVTIYFFVY